MPTSSIHDSSVQVETATRLSSGVCRLNPAEGSNGYWCNAAKLKDQVWKLRKEAAKSIGFCNHKIMHTYYFSRRYHILLVVNIIETNVDTNVLDTFTVSI